MKIILFQLKMAIFQVNNSRIISYNLHNKLAKHILEGKQAINTELGENPTNAQILESLGSIHMVINVFIKIYNS